MVCSGKDSYCLVGYENWGLLPLIELAKLGVTSCQGRQVVNSYTSLSFHSVWIRGGRFDGTSEVNAAFTYTQGIIGLLVA